MVAHLKLPPIRMTHDPNDSDGSESTARNLNKSAETPKVLITPPPSEVNFKMSSATDEFSNMQDDIIDNPESPKSQKQCQKSSDPEFTELTELVKCTKAYKNNEFLHSPAARLLRVQCELMEPGERLEANRVDNIIMFFGSARAKSREEYDLALANLTKTAQDDPSFLPSLERMKKQEFLIRYYEETTDLARKVAVWSKEREESGAPSYHVATGGGPGMMCAANKGAALADAKTVGFGISVPFEDGLNPYVTPDLAFEFHYFFTRKFWMAYKMMGLIIAPGGFGTLDELFELLTLMQTGKIKRKVPIILLGKTYWESVMNWQSMVDHGMISQADADSVSVVDTADEAMEILRNRIPELETKEATSPTIREKRMSMSPLRFRAD